MKHELTPEELQTLLDKQLSKTDFLSAFKQMVDLVKTHQASNKQDLGAVQGRYDQIVSDIKKNYNSDMASVKKEALDFAKEQISGMVAKHEARVTAIENKNNALSLSIPLRVQGEMKKLKQDVIQAIPSVDEIASELPNMGKEVRDALEKLQGDNRLDKTAIKGWDEFEKRITGIAKGANTSHYNLQGGVGKTNVHYYDLSSQLNGVLKTFSLPAFARIIQVNLSSAPVLRQTIDYTVDASALTITFTSEIEASSLLAGGQSLIVLYAV